MRSLNVGLFMFLAALLFSPLAAAVTPTPTRTPTRTRTPTPTPTPTWPVACETPVYKGNDLIRVTVRYAHEATPGVPYRVRLGPIHFEDDGQAVIRAEAHPTGCVWKFTIIFADGFESGTTGGWSHE